MGAVVIMPDHLHCIWQLPEDDSNFSIRWQLVKQVFQDQLKKVKWIIKVTVERESEEFGSVVFGNMLFVMRLIM